MHVHRLADATTFLAAVSPLITLDEARHNLMFGLAATLRDHPAAYPTAHLWVVEDGDRPVAAALQTPPRNLILAQPTSEAALDALVSAIAESGLGLPGVSGAMPEAAQFAARWIQHTGGTWREQMAVRIYALSTLDEVPTAPGGARQATPADDKVIARMVQAFSDDAHTAEADDPAALQRMIDTRLGSQPSRGGFWLWEDGGAVVSLTGHSGPTPHGIRIGPVYTPPERRGRGYATSLVATQSRWLLANGYQFCFLYTDLANPTSNGIYQRIGYAPVCDAAVIAFDA